MKSWIAAAAGCLALSTGCSGQSQNGSDGAGNRMPAGNAAGATGPEASLTGEARFRRLAECSATVEALSHLYDAIASQEQGARKADLLQTAEARRSAATILELDAFTAGRPLGRTTADIARIKTETRASIEAERARQRDFGDFAIWLGREADRCAALDPTAG